MNDHDESGSDDGDYLSPQNLAWQLLMDDFKGDLTSAIVGFTQDNDYMNDPTSFTFEMLLTIFTEMIVQMATILQQDSVIDTNQDIDEKYYQFNDFFNVIQNILKGSNILCNILQYDRNENDYLRKIINDRYCRIIFKYNTDDKHYFETIEDDVQYHFLLNQSTMNKKNDQLKNIYAIIITDTQIYKISFDRILIESNHCR